MDVTLDVAGLAAIVVALSAFGTLILQLRTAAHAVDATRGKVDVVDVKVDAVHDLVNGRMGDVEAALASTLVELHAIQVAYAAQTGSITPPPIPPRPAAPK